MSNKHDIKEVKSYIINMQLKPGQTISVHSNGDLIPPTQYKMYNSIYYRDTDGPLKSIGFEIVSAKEKSTENEISFEMEVIINVDTEKQTPKFVKQYIDLVAKPVLAKYWLDTIQTAISVNNYVDTNWSDDLIEETSIHQ